MEKEFRIERVSSENNFIDIKFQGKTFKQSYFNLLSKVGENIKRLDLSFVDLSSVNLSKLDDLENLTYLNLNNTSCLLYTSPSPRDLSTSRMPSSA